MVEVFVDDGFIVDLGTAITLYIPSEAEQIAFYEDFQLHNHIEHILVDDDNKFFFAKNDCLLKNTENGNIELVLGCKNSNIPSVHIIGRSSFNGVDMNCLALPESVFAIGQTAFANSTLKEIKFNSGIENIEDMAFLFTNIKSVFIPPRVKNIGYGVFSGCKMLKEITVDESNDKYYSKNNCIIEKTTECLIACSQNAIVPEGVKNIGVLTFYGFDKDCVITLPTSVTHINKVKMAIPSSIQFPITFKAPKGSYAIRFAKDNGIKYIEI